MITVQEATEIILKHLHKPSVRETPLHETIGYRLAEGIRADRDLPPFNRATMDGIALNSNNLGKARQLTVTGVQSAGMPPLTIPEGAYCIEIMTGAMVPESADTIVPYEAIQIEKGICTVNGDVTKGQFIHRRGSDATKGELLLDTGTIIGPAEVAVMASVGKATVNVFDVKPVAIIGTGDELVDIHETPKDWQIRKSNVAALQAALATMNIPSSVYHLPDNEQSMTAELGTILHNHDILLMSGGVSKGKFDFVPLILEKAGVRKEFHRVSQRPGKPFWFGRSEKHTVFALPGNPVSTFMCFFRYVKPWLEKSLYHQTSPQQAKLASDVTFEADLTYFIQVEIRNEGGTVVAYPVPGEGSGDFANLRNVSGFLELPRGRQVFQRGESFPLISFRS